MLPGLLASLSQLPYLIASAVLFGVALWGWRRTAAPGALLVAASAVVQTLNQLFGMWTMAELYTNRSPGSYVVKMAMVATVRTSAGMVAEALLIVGLALLLRLLPARRA